MTWHFIDEFSEESARTTEGISDEAMEAMLAYEWPGNVRELRNVVRRALIVGSGPTIEFEDLTPELRGERVDGDTSPAGERGARPAASEPTTERELERRRLLDALDQAGGKKQQAAELLDISRTTLWRKLKEHGISED